MIGTSGDPVMGKARKAYTDKRGWARIRKTGKTSPLISTDDTDLNWANRKSFRRKIRQMSADQKKLTIGYIALQDRRCRCARCRLPDDEGSKSGKKVGNKGHCTKNIFQSLCGFSSMDASRDSK